jgi:hypothetical protein
MKSLRTVALKTEWFFTFDLFCFLFAGMYSYWAMPWISSTYVCSGSFFLLCSVAGTLFDASALALCLD